MATKTKTKTKKVTKTSTVGMEFEQKMIANAVAQNYPVLLIGETGVGKTHIVREVAKEAGKELVRFSVNGEVGTSELLGKWLVRQENGASVTHWIDGPLTDAVRNGKWIVVDEINAALPEILFSLHSLLDDDRKLTLSEKDGEVVEAHPDFRFFGTMNPTDEYAGTKDLNKAFISRFPVVYEVLYQEPQIERDILKMHVSGLDNTTASVIIDIGTSIRNLKRSGEIFYSCSTRDLISMAKLMKLGYDLSDSFSLAIGFKTHPSEREKLIKALHTAAGEHLSGFETAKDFAKLTEGMTLNIDELKEEAEKEIEKFKEEEVAKVTAELDDLKVQLEKEVKELTSKKEAMKAFLDAMES